MEATTKSLNDVLRKVQALIAKADSTEFPDEAQAFRRKAEALMHQYRIEESMLAAAAPVGAGPALVWAEWEVHNMGSEFNLSYQAIAGYIVHHVGARTILKYSGNKLVAEVVGYESDLRYGEMLFTSAKLAFGKLLEPTVDRNVSDRVNAYNMRKAGMEGIRIAAALWGTVKGVGNWKTQCQKVRRMYRQEAELRGEDPSEMSGHGMDTYRRSYAEGFVLRIAARLRDIRYTKGEESTALILSGRKEAVDNAFYERYPNLRPNDKTRYYDPRDGCERCQKAKSGYCKDHRYLKPRAGKSQAYNHDAASRGAEAANTVDLGTKGRLT